jgi:hypothetical protein
VDGAGHREEPSQSESPVREQRSRRIGALSWDLTADAFADRQTADRAETVSTPGIAAGPGFSAGTSLHNGASNRSFP